MSVATTPFLPVLSSNERLRGPQCVNLKATAISTPAVLLVVDSPSRRGSRPEWSARCESRRAPALTPERQIRSQPGSNWLSGKSDGKKGYRLLMSDDLIGRR